MNFNELFSINECAKGSIWGGAIDIYKTNNNHGLLLSTSDVLRSRDEDTSIPKDNRAQDDNSFYNKILFYDFDTKKLNIFSKGHVRGQDYLVLKISTPTLSDNSNIYIDQTFTINKVEAKFKAGVKAEFVQ